MPPPSRRQLDILAVALNAGSVKEAAFTLGIEYGELRWMLSRLYHQLGVTNMAQAVHLCDQRWPGWHSQVAVPPRHKLALAADG